jgi:uncharacterized protein with GYD domain
LILDVGAALPPPRKACSSIEEEMPMPKYMIQASYTAEGLKGLQKDKASGRRAAVGEDDAVAILDLPDNVSASALSLAVSASGLVRTKTTPLLTVDETDQALQKSANYRAPGG